MDALQTSIAELVAADADAGVSPRSTHAAIRRLTAKAALDEGSPGPTREMPLLPERDAPPRLSEPWFCCAEPTTAQLAIAGVALGA